MEVVGCSVIPGPRGCWWPERRETSWGRSHNSAVCTARWKHSSSPIQANTMLLLTLSSLIPKLSFLLQIFFKDLKILAPPPPPLYFSFGNYVFELQPWSCASLPLGWGTQVRQKVLHHRSGSRQGKGFLLAELYFIPQGDISLQNTPPDFEIIHNNYKITKCQVNKKLLRMTLLVLSAIRRAR